jgi:hypothetical protein
VALLGGRRFDKPMKSPPFNQGWYGPRFKQSLVQSKALKSLAVFLRRRQ